jgi:hypothetical protein
LSLFEYNFLGGTQWSGGWQSSQKPERRMRNESKAMTHNQIVSIIDNSYDHENDINNVKIISIA